MSDRTPVPPDGVSLEAWEKLAKPRGDGWAIPERDDTGAVIGTAYRLANGDKDSKKGGKRGLIYVAPWSAYAGTSADDPLFICEGASDTGALLGLLLDAVGAPMAGQCGQWLASLAKGQHVCIVADNDKRGLQGANKIAGALYGKAASVKIILPPLGKGDVRESVIAGAHRQDFLDAAGSTDEWTPDTDAGADDDPYGGAIVLNCADVTPTPVRWLWQDRIALGKVTLLSGDPGLGKSFLTMDIASRVSRGAPWPDDAGNSEQGGVVILSAEDGVADTIVPRLKAMDAELARVRAVTGVRLPDDETGEDAELPFNLKRDVRRLEKIIASMGGECRLVIIDPISAYMGSTDGNKNEAVRAVLTPAAMLAERYDVAVLVVSHLNKSNLGPALYRTMGSLAYMAASRGAMIVVRDKEDTDRRLLLPTKSNLAKETTGLAFRLQSGPDDEYPIVAWEPDPVTLSADDALDSSEQGGERADAETFLRELLADGPVHSAEVFAEGESLGFSEGVLRGALKRLGGRSKREGYGSEGRFVWTLAPVAEGV